MIRKFIEEKIAEYKRELAWYNFKNALGRILRAVLCIVLLLGVVYFLGMHHKVIASLLKGEEVPEVPEGCCWKK